MAKNPYLEVLLMEPLEREVVTSFYLRESIAVSLGTICERMQVKKKDIVNQLLEVALEQYVQAIYETRPDLMIDDHPDTDQKVWSIVSPAAVREAKRKYTGLEFDFNPEDED